MLCWMKPKCMHPVAVRACHKDELSLRMNCSVQVRWKSMSKLVCQTWPAACRLCERVCLCVFVWVWPAAEKKNTPKNNKDDGVILWCPGEVILTPTDWNIYQTFLEKIQVQMLPMTSAQSISHFVINIIYFFNIIQHLIQIPYSWEDGWMEPPNY